MGNFVDLLERIKRERRYSMIHTTSGESFVCYGLHTIKEILDDCVVLEWQSGACPEVRTEEIVLFSAISHIELL